MGSEADLDRARLAARIAAPRTRLLWTTSVLPRTSTASGRALSGDPVARANGATPVVSGP